MNFINKYRLLPRIICEKIEKRHNLQKIFTNTGWLLTDKVFRMIVGLLLGAWVARYLGPEQLGMYSYAAAFVALFGALATIGLNSVVPRDIVRNPFDKEEIMGTAFVLLLIGGILVTLITSIAIILLKPQDCLIHWLVCIIAAGSIFQSFNTIDFYFQSQIQSKYTICVQSAAFIITSIFKIILILNHSSLIAFAWVGLIEAILGGVGLIIIYHLKGQSIKVWRWNTLRAKNLLSSSWPLIFSSIFVLINMHIDKIMLGEISGSIEVGFYSVATKFTEILYFIPVAIGSSVAPILVKEIISDNYSYLAKLQKTYNLMTVSAIVFALPMTFLSKKLIYVIYGQSYSSAAHILSVHIWSAIFVFHVSIRSKSLIIEGKQKFIAIYAFFAMGSNVVFNYILIPPYGGVGAAYASLLSWMLCVLVLPYISGETSQSVLMFFKSLNFVYLLRKP